MGHQLGVEEYQMQSIEASRSNRELLDYKREMFTLWINSGTATWENLCDALCDPLVNMHGVAQRIRQKYC